MASPNIYTDVNFKTQPVSSGTISDSSSAPPKKTTIHKSSPGFPMLLLASLIFFLLMAILSSVALIILFQMYSDLLEEKNTMKQLNHTKLDCMKDHVSMEDKVWNCCPKNWKPFSSQCYFISTDAASWSESQEKCSSMGAHLMVIHSQEEQDFITKILNSNAAYYIGLSDPGHQQWRWVDQTPYNENSTFWHPGDPNSDNEQCVIINHPYSSWGWNDVPCSGKQKSVCQMKKIYL
ncbi:C-type lectin domain family 4 member A-like isoform X1 [Peromyscus californicus insignis]|uniref:C-type lectin domain family 4 member A-like isoform X1 n=1 Tax=Peromyscus californicus insignis TaxID=564181 RepID=UPI0022A79F4F|nr:C-type lectin domain family 4 member A-like isoform X1 [Peromyscus californicus insignis]